LVRPSIRPHRLDPAKPDHGCYTNDGLSELTNSVWHVPTGKPLIFSEFGAYAKSGFHAGANPQKFSQEFQAEFYRQTLAVEDKLPMLRGLSLWTLRTSVRRAARTPISRWAGTTSG
jgi:hypothetical protein